MPDPLLSVVDLQAAYGPARVLHGVSFDLMPGETATILGRNGAGKTTTLKSIMAVLPDRSGIVRLDGRDIHRQPAHAIARAGIGYVPEDRGIFASLSVRENLMLPVGAPAGQGHSLDEIFELFPNLAERLNSSGGTLSGGEQQMLAMARILRTGPRLLILDEPTEGLAPAIVRAIADALRGLQARGLTILMVEQNFGFARTVSDQFYLMDQGLIVDSFGASDIEARAEDLLVKLGV